LGPIVLSKWGKVVAPRTPNAANGIGVHGVGEVAIKDDALRRQEVEVRRLDPGIAVAAECAGLQTTGNDHEDFHASILRGKRQGATDETRIEHG
jgi:hypothetical protein